MIIIANIIMFITVYTTVSTFLYTSYLNKKTSYNDSELPDKSTLIMFLLGPFCLLFIKNLKKYRKRLYYKKHLSYLKMMRKFDLDFSNIHPGYKITNENDKKIQQLERVLALEKLNKKW